MRLFLSVFVAAWLGCCLGPATPDPAAQAPAPAPSPLAQALTAESTPAPSAPAATTPPPGFGAPAGAVTPTTSNPVVTPTAATPDTPACAQARAAREQVRAQIAQLRLTLGGDTTHAVEVTGEAMKNCDAESGCLRDAKARLARIEAYDRAKAALEAEQQRLATAEVGLYDADRAVTAACGAP